VSLPVGPRGSWQLDDLVSADAASIDGLQPGQGIVPPRHSLLVAVRGGQEVRRNVRPEDLMGDGQRGERDIVQILTLIGRDDKEAYSAASIW
jgi:hypothetical protein